MKMNQLVGTAAFIAAVSLAAPSAMALTSAQATAVKKAVTSVSAPEMPAKAAELVKQASKEDREATAVTAVRAAIYKNRSVAPSVVAAIAKVAPDVASAIALAATQMEREQATAIAGAAIAAAPGSRAEIQTSVTTAYRPAPASPITPSAPINFTPSTSVPQSPIISTPGGFERSLGASPVVVTVSQQTTPINPTTGGNGTGSYAGATAAPAGPSTPVDYSAPRSF